MIKIIVLVKSKIMHLPICLILLLQNSSNNEAYDLKILICEMNNKCYLLIQLKQNIMSTIYIMMMY